jgi:hypothetical protein
VAGSWDHRFPTPAMLSSFPTKLAVSTVHRPRLSCPNRFILPYASRLFRVLPARTRPAPPGVEHLPWGWPSLFATSARSVLTTGFHPRRLAVLGVSHALDGFLRCWPCGFVSPHSHVQGSPFRGFPPRTAVAPRRRPVALASVGDGSLLTVARQRHVPPPRPQGFSPCGNPLPNLRCLAADPARSPPGLSLLQVFALDAVRMPSHPLPLVTLTGNLSSHPPGWSSAFRRRAWLTSLEAADLLEVSGLPSTPSFPNVSV